MKKLLLFVVILILFIPLAFALKVISPYPIGPRITNINVSTATTNNSLYWDGHPYSNLISQWANDMGYYNASTLVVPPLNDTLQTVTDRGFSTTHNITVEKITSRTYFMFNNTWGIMKNESGDIIIGFLGGLI